MHKHAITKLTVEPPFRSQATVEAINEGGNQHAILEHTVEAINEGGNQHAILEHTVEAINEGGNQHAILKLTVKPPFRPGCFDNAHGLLAMLTRTEGHLCRADERRVAWTRRTGRVAMRRRTGRVARERAETLWQRLKRQRRVGRGVGARVLGNLLRRLGQRLNGRGAAMGAAS